MKIFVTPRKAATVALIRDTIDSNKIEVLLMKRHLNDRFLPGYHVFPGGAVDERDVPEGVNFDEYLNGMTLEFVEDKINYITHAMCAIRETFEEAGILLAEDRGKYFSMEDPAVHENFSAYRKQIFNGELEMTDLFKREKLEPSFRSIYYLTRWITPVFFPIRYDTRFFVAIAPGEQKTCHDGDELITSEWITPAKALTMYKSGSMKIVTPTISTLEFLEKFSTTEDVINHIISERVSSPARSF